MQMTTEKEGIELLMQIYGYHKNFIFQSEY